MSQFQSIIRSVGGYLPEKKLTNDDLSKMVDTTDDWIKERTGIRSRHIAAEGEVTSDLAIIAAKQALERAEMDPQEIDLIILATSTPNQTFPATAVTIQAELGITHGAIQRRHTIQFWMNQQQRAKLKRFRLHIRLGI